MHEIARLVEYKHFRVAGLDSIGFYYSGAQGPPYFSFWEPAMLFPFMVYDGFQFP